MSESHIITGLVNKRSELSGLLDFHQIEIKQIQADILILDKSIKLFDPAYDLRTIKSRKKNKKNSFFHNRDGNTMLMDIIRQSSGTISTQEIAEEVIKRNSLDKGSLDLKALKACIFTILKRLQNKQIIKQSKSEGQFIHWSRV
jgi:hypothetical protein